MRAVVHIGLSWRGYDRPQGPKLPEELERDKQRVRGILQRMGYDNLFQPEQPSYDFALEKGDKRLGVLIEELQKWPELASPNIQVVKYYTRQELEAAELLIWGPTNQAIEDDYYDFDYYDPSQTIRERDVRGVGPSFSSCPSCGAPLKQVRDLVVNKALMRGKDVSLTYAFEVILSERVGRLLQEHGLTGFDLRPVHHYKKPYKGEPMLYQLVVTNVLPPMASPPTEFERVLECAVCGRRSQYLKHTHWWGKIQYYEDTEVYYPRRVLEVAKDFNHTAEYFGELRVSHSYVIITQRVYRLLGEHKVRNWAAVPVYLVD